MEKIVITDNFLDEFEMKKIREILEEKKLQYGIKSGGNTIWCEKFFSVLNTESFFFETILKKIQSCQKKKFMINRHYIQIQTYGKNGDYHTDSDNYNIYTFCLYIHDIPFQPVTSKEELAENTGGEFFIKFPDKKEIVCIDPLSNRGVLFPSNYLHNGGGFNRFYPNSRNCFVWQMIEET